MTQKKHYNCITYLIESFKFFGIAVLKSCYIPCFQTSFESPQKNKERVTQNAAIQHGLFYKLVGLLQTVQFKMNEIPFLAKNLFSIELFV